MQTLVGILQVIAVFVGGLLARVLVVVAVMAALLAPFVLLIGLVRAVRWAVRRAHAHGEGG
jgi:hypothetical protein